MKLQYKLYLFFTGVVLLPLLVATLTASFVLERSSHEAYENRMRSAMAAASAVISADAQHLADDFQAGLPTVDLATLATGNNAQRRAILDSLMAKTGTSSATVVDSAGNTVISASASASVSTAGQPVTPDTPRLATTAELGPPDNKWRITATRPFSDATLSDIFTSQQLNWAILRDGEVAAGNLPPESQIIPKENDVDPGAPTASSGGNFVEVFINEVTYLSSSTNLPPTITDGGTMIFTGVPLDVVGAAAGRVLTVGVGFMFLVMAAAGFLGFLMARNITSPLRELNEAASAGIEGNFDRRVVVRSHDEIGSLAGSFNLMQDSLVKYISELEESRGELLLALSYAGDILESTADRKRLLKVTANAALLATGAQAIWVESFGREKVFLGVPAGFFEGVRRETAHRLSLDVAAGNAAEGEAVFMEDGLGMAAYPMHKDKQIHGALVAVFDHPLEESRQRILGSLSAQAASALDNVDIGDLQRQLAITDPMTGLYNFRFLIDSLGNEMEKSRRYNRTVTMAILDLDDFKHVNDLYGHPTGDELLKATAAVLKGNVRGADIVARYGGEEFAVVMPETGKVAAVQVMNKLKEEVAAIRLADYPDLRITVSIGVAGFPEDADNQTDLMARADEALYRSKKGGKNQVTAASAGA